MCIYIYIYIYAYTCISLSLYLSLSLYIYIYIYIYVMLVSGKSSERHAEGARPPRRRKYISVIVGLLSQSRS